MNKFFFISLILLAASLTTVGQAGGKISGKVAYSNNLPLHDASVQIIQTKQTTRTNADGGYEFADLPPGRYTILVHLEGFTDSAKPVIVTTGAVSTLDFQLEIASIREEVTVTASGTETTIFDAFQSVNSIGSTRIIERASTSIGEVLDSETGIAKRSFGPGTARPVIRGFDGDRVLVLQNGVRVGSVGSQSGDHGEPIDPLSAERIEVVKGPATLLYGSNALGGVVNVIGNDENDAHEGFRGFATVVGGSADRQAGFAGGGEFGIGKWLVRGNLGAQRSGNYQSPIGKIPNSASRSNSGSLSLGYYAKKAYVSAGYTGDIRRYGVPFAALFEEKKPPADGVLPIVDDEIDLRARRHNFRISGGFRELANSFLSGVQYHLDYTDYRHKEIERADGIDTVGTIFDNKTFSYRSLFEQTKYGRLTGRFGFEGFNRDYEINGAEQLIEGPVRQNSFSFFALEELAFERVKFQFGGRIENNRYRAQDPELRDRSFTGFSGAAGINISLWDGGAFVANYSHSYRAPALEELYNNGPHIGNITFEIGNDNLLSERANGIDLSLRHQSGRFRFTGNVYYYRIDNFVFLAYQDKDGDGVIDRIDGLPVARYEQANASYLGAELSGEVTFYKYIGGFLNFDTVRARLVDANLNLPRIPPARARLGFDLRFKDLNVRPEAVFAAKQDKIFPLETPTAGYGLINVAGSYTIGRRHYAHVITFNAYNLTNKLYRNHISFIKDLMPEIGRGIRLGYTIRFF